MHTQGVLVVGTSDLTGAHSPARLAGIQAGDLITEAAGVTLESSAQLLDLIGRGGATPLPLTVRRGESTLRLTLEPKRDGQSGDYRIGAWVRDSTAGIGTLSFYDPESGRIAIDGADIRSLTRKSLRRAYTMVLQDTWLFCGTVRENIAYGGEQATDARVEAAAKAARIHDYIMSLPDGYDTLITDNGSNISKGQKQLLTIARAMLLDSPMLILDEATSNVDTQTERRIQDAMLRLMQGRTCFVIAHRLSTVQHADRILVVNGGDIVEQGTHEELMEKGGFYREIYQAQFSA